MQRGDDVENSPWDRVLLGCLSWGAVGLGLLFTVLLDEDSGPNDWLTGVVIVGVGILGMLATAIGRAFARWVLAGFGLLLLAGAASTAADLLSYDVTPSRWTIAMVAGLAGVGLLAMGVAIAQTAMNRRPGQPAESGA